MVNEIFKNLEFAVKVNNKELIQEELNNLLDLANAGDSQAQSSMGFVHLFGYGEPKNYSKTIKWWKC